MDIKLFNIVAIVNEGFSESVMDVAKFMWSNTLWKALVRCKSLVNSWSRPSFQFGGGQSMPISESKLIAKSSGNISVLNEIPGNHARLARHECFINKAVGLLFL